MEQRQLLNFLCNCEEKHITRAADRRFITRQGLSKSLRELEEELVPGNNKYFTQQSVGKAV
jgi:DNA-binding transcriptional LysR family regulator